MKPRKSQPARKKSAGGTLIGMFIGLVLGMGAAAGVVWYMNKSPLPFVDKSPAPRAEAQVAANGQPAQPMALPGKPGDPIPEKRFQFYDILPGKTDAVPEKTEPAPALKEVVNKDAPKKEERKEEKKEAPKESKQALFLQAGSFSTANDADNQKAKLAFMGVEAVVQQVMVQDKTYFRVRVGPYNQIDELNKVRAELAKAGVESALAKSTKE
jgi:cell division protein FtsN